MPKWGMIISAVWVDNATYTKRLWRIYTLTLKVRGDINDLRDGAVGWLTELKLEL